jgi:hypothetical protein
MQPHGFHTWTGCTETVSLAQAVVEPKAEFVPELMAEKLRQPSPMSETRLDGPALKATGERAIARTEEAALSITPAELAIQEFSVRIPAQPPPIEGSNLPSPQGSKGLWSRLSRPPHLESASLQAIPDEPGEVRYRVWVDPVREDIQFTLDRATATECPLEKLPDPDAHPATLSGTDEASLPRSPQVEEFSVAGLAARQGSSLDSIQTQQISEPQVLLYPATRRLPKPVLA